MKRSTDRVLTTHVGSLPRPQDVTDLVFAKEAGVPIDPAGFDAVISATTNAVVQRQMDIGFFCPPTAKCRRFPMRPTSKIA